jgi:hypothetical protein
LLAVAKATNSGWWVCYEVMDGGVNLKCIAVWPLEQATMHNSVLDAHNKAWFRKHGKVVKADKLHPAVIR